MVPKDEIVEAILAIKADLDQRHGENVTRAQVNETLIKDLIVRVDGLYHAFPDEDPSGHRRYHEAMIKRIEARGKLYEALRTELVTKGMWAFLGLIATALGFYIKSKVKG